MKLTNLIIAVVLCSFLSLASLAFAKDSGHRWPKVSGELISVDIQASTFQIKDVNGLLLTFRVTPATDMEFEDRSLFSWDDDASISELSAGQWLKVKYYGVGETKVAEDVDIYPVPKR